MSLDWFSNPGVLAYGTAALAFAWLGLRLVTHWHPGGKPAMLLAMAVATAAAAVASIVFAERPGGDLGWTVAFLDFARVGATLGFLLAFLGVRKTGDGGERRGHGIAPLIGVGIALMALWLLVGVKPPGVLDPVALTRQLGYASALGVAAFGLVLVEQCYRRTPVGSRWPVRPMILAFAGLFAYDVVLYSDALMFGVMDFQLWVARGFAQAITVPLILVTLKRRSDWSFDLSVSRGVVAGSAALLLTGGYLLLVSGAGFLLRQFGGSWGRALETALLFAALLLLAVIALSGTFRSKLRVLVAKHFFTYRFDYREEWLKLTSTLGASAAARPWAACIEAIGSLVESPGGALWLRTSAGSYRQVERASFPAVAEEVDGDASLPRFLAQTGWVVELQELRKEPARYAGLALPDALAAVRDAWLLVPLLTAHDLVGFIVLATPRAQLEVDWEVRDLLKTAGRQAAGYLAYAKATEALLEAQKFDAFNRMSTFVVHDLKNLIAQLQLLLSNAERHRDNPEFQRDMLNTIEHVVGRMHQLTLQLRPEASAGDRPQPVDVGIVAARIKALRLGGRDALQVAAEANATAWAHEDLLERVVAHLVHNAFDASNDEDTVQLTVQRTGDEIVVEVIDQGVGMTQEFIRERLFRPFQTTKSTGMGIGVYECQQYVQRIGGRIQVDSTPGEGTRVRLYLRAVEAASLALGEAA